MFGVKSLICFALDFGKLREQENQENVSNLPTEINQIKSGIENLLKDFNNIKEGEPSLNNYRYADDSMFKTSISIGSRATVMKKYFTQRMYKQRQPKKDSN